MILRENMTISPEGGEVDLLHSLIGMLMEKFKEKKMVSYGIERFLEKSDPQDKWETYKPTGREEIRVVFESRKEKDGG